jgi:DNA-binding HxlR family transcriptional regulator
MNMLKNQERCRFKELLKIVNNPRTLSKKLNYLLSIGLIEVDENGYRLTEEGLEATK